MASTRAISFLYSSDPRQSALGDAAAPARLPASANTSSLGAFPTRNFSASVTRMGLGPAFVSATPAFAIVPPETVSCTATAAVA